MTMIGELTYEQYEHHGAKVWVRADLRGTHRQICLCFKCEKFKPSRDTNCPIAQVTFDNCVRFNTVTPVLECPEFELSSSPTP